MTLQELYDRKGRLANEAQQILARAAGEQNRDLTAEETARFDAIHDEIETQVNPQIRRLERHEETLRAINEPGERRSSPNPPGREPGRQATPAVPFPHLEGLRSWLLAGAPVDRTPAMRAAAERAGFSLESTRGRIFLSPYPLRDTTPEGIRAWDAQHDQLRAQSSQIGAAGGFTIGSEPLRPLEIAMTRFGGMRRTSTIIRTDTGARLGFPTMNDTTNEGVEIAENTQAAQQDVAFEQLELDAYTYTSKIVLVPFQLLQDSAINFGEVIGSALGMRLGRIGNRRFTTGNNANQPNGIVNAATLGKTGATGQTTSIIYDDLVDLEHSVDPDYRAMGARWMFADTTLKALKKIKIPQFSGDTAGMPLWQPGLREGQPDNILGYGYEVNNHMPVMAANAKSVIFGALEKYVIRDVREIFLVRLDERYADFGQVAFVAFARFDGDLLDAGTNPVKYYANSAT